MRSLEARPEEAAPETVKPETNQLTDYITLMKSHIDAPNGLSSPPRDNHLPTLKTESEKDKSKEKPDSSAGFLPPETKDGKCVEALMKKIGLPMDLETDPEIMKDILHNDMKLDDCPAVQKLLGSRLTTKESLQPMLKTIQESILAKHPAVHEMIDAALRENLIPPVDDAGRKTIERSLNHMVILDAITRGMADDYHVMEDVRNHLINKRKDLGIREDFLGSTYDIYKVFGDWFGPAKTKSVDIAFDRFLEMRKRGHENKFDLPEKQTLLELNLAEAILTDKQYGFPDNAKAGLYLALHPFSKIWLSGNNRSVAFDFDQKWDSLYETWNLAFITGNISNPQLLYPKLLIPQVIDAKPEDYLFNRALALWLTINFQLFAHVDKKSVIMPGSQALAKRWGEINLAQGKMFDEEERLKHART